MAKLGGIKVTQFAFGFGQKLFGFQWRGTEYRWNLIPLGGYVDFMGELVYTNKIPDDVAHFYNRPKWIRFLVLVMGPVFNMILGFAIFWIYHSVQPHWTLIPHGEGYTVGYVAPDSPEATAGLQIEDRILTINGEPVSQIDQVGELILFNPGKNLDLELKRGDQRVQLTYEVPTHQTEGVGVQNFQASYQVMVERVVKNSPAEKAGLKKSDIITHINGQRIYYNQVVRDTIQNTFAERASSGSSFTVERNNKVFDIQVFPEKDEDDRWIAGFLFAPESFRQNLTVSQAFFQAWDSVGRYSTLIFTGVRKLITGQISVKALSGPIGVGRVAKETLDVGFLEFLLLMAVLSLNLGILNLLPIPVLDGGEIFVLLVEWITRKDFSLNVKMKIKIVGFFFLIGLMAVVIFNDVWKLFVS